MKKVCVIGEGAWGTAISTLLANNGLTVNLWCHHSDVAKEITNTRENKKYLPGVILDRKIVPKTNFQDALFDVEWVFEAIPVQFLRFVLQKALPFYKPEQKWVVLSKGIESETLMFPLGMIDDVFKNDVKKVVLAGPSFAKDLSEKSITGVTLARQNLEYARQLKQLVDCSYFTSVLSDDVVGAEVGAALKNVLAIGVGMILGAGFSDNTKVLLFTNGFGEVVKLAKAMGAKAETLYGLSGIGDSVLTCMGQHSRNVKTGKLLGQGKKLQEILDQTGMIPEGINTVKSVNKLADNYNVSMPLCKGIFQVIFQEKSIENFLSEFVAKS